MQARSISCCVVILFASLNSPLLAADNWPQWRGPDAKGVAADGEYPVKFSDEENVAWKVALPGPGSSTPAVWDDSIFVTCGIDGEDGLVCYGFDGQERWRKTLGKEKPGRHRNGSGSNPSPVTDGERVVVYFKSGTVGCFDFAGKQLWRLNVVDKYGEDTLWWDRGTSPVLVDDRVVIAVMQSGNSYLVALDVATGEEAWKQKRQYERPVESDHAYTTPQVAEADGRKVIVTWGADYLTGHDAATGEQLWESAGFNPRNEENWRVIASHAMGDGIAVVPYGRGKFLAAVRLGGQGDVTESNRLWEKQGDVGGDVPTPIVHDGKVYVLTDKGKVICRELETGAEVWAGQFRRRGDAKFYASPVLAGDKLYCAREDGMVFVADVRDGFKSLTDNGNDMGERIIATPVPVRGGLLIRGSENLFRIESESASAASPSGG